MVDALSCETTQYHTPWVYKAQQSSTDDPLVIDMFNSSVTPTANLDTRARLVQEENAEDANPMESLRWIMALFQSFQILQILLRLHILLRCNL